MIDKYRVDYYNEFKFKSLRFTNKAKDTITGKVFSMFSIVIRGFHQVNNISIEFKETLIRVRVPDDTVLRLESEKIITMINLFSKESHEIGVNDLVKFVTKDDNTFINKPELDIKDFFGWLNSDEAINYETKLIDFSKMNLNKRQYDENSMKEIMSKSIISWDNISKKPPILKSIYNTTSSETTLYPDNFGAFTDNIQGRFTSSEVLYPDNFGTFADI